MRLLDKWRRWLILLPFMAGAGLPSFARAGAWMQPKGHGQNILTSTFTTSGMGFDANGRAIDIPRYNKFELDALTEYGLTDNVTAILQPQLRSVSIAPPTDAAQTGAGYTDLGARVRLWSNGWSVVSGQALLRIPGSSDKNDPAEIGSTDTQVDVRGLYGHSFKIGVWQAFLDAELAYRYRSGDPSNEIRADLTIGVRPKPDLLFMAQSFNTFSQGPAQGVFSQGREHKLALSVVWDVSKNWSLQVGGIGTVGGANTLRERGGLVAIWKRF